MIVASYARALHRDLVAQGVDERLLLRDTGLDRDRIWTSTKLDSAQFLAFLKNARRLLPDGALGFMMVSHSRLAALGMMGIAMLSAATMREGLLAMVSFSVVQAGYVKLAVIADKTHTEIRVDYDIELGDVEDIHTESVLGLLQEYVSLVSGRDRGQLEYKIGYPAPTHWEEYERNLQGPVSFAQPRTKLLVPTDWVDSPSPYADAELWAMTRRYLLDQLDRRSSESDRPFTTQLQRFLAAHQPPLPDVSQTAGAFHTSTRTLLRRLGSEQTTFRTLRLSATHSWAKRLLREGLSVEATALQLGYDNPANFRRSFKEFVGTTPSNWLARVDATSLRTGFDAKQTPSQH